MVAIKLKDSHLLDSIPDQRYFVTGIKSSGLSPSEPDDTPNHYYEDPCKTRAAVQAEMKVKGACMRVLLFVWEFTRIEP